MNRNPSMAGLASLVQSRGREGDTMLVHMTPSEVRGLQSLALAHGGQLTINPETGLYEANFLKKLLPTLIGAVLTPLTGGLINPFTAGLLVGGVETIRTGDLGRGLMAGLGAYGGAGLSTALAGTGAAAAQAGAGEAIKAAGTTAAEEAAKAAGKTATEELIKQKTQEEAAKRIAEQTATKGLLGRLPENVASFSNIGKGFSEIAGGGANLGGIGSLSTAGSAFNAGFPSQIGRGAAIMGAANALTPEMEVPEGGAYNIDDSYYESMGYSPEQGRFLGGQWRKGYPGFPGYAMGGAVMPRANFNYPQAGISKSSYAPTIDYTQPREVLDGYEVKLDPFTGEEKFAEGGEVGMMAPDELKNFLTVSPGAPMPTRTYQEMPMEASLLQPNSAKADWLRYLQQNPEAQKPYLDAGYPPEFFQQDPNTFTGARPFIPGKDEQTLASEQARLNQMGYAPSYFEQFKAPSSSAYTPFSTSNAAQNAPQQSLEDYYQSLLTPPQQRPADNSFMNYMQSLNNYVTSPVAPPKPSVQPPQTPPNQPPGNDRVTGTGGTGTGMVYDPTTGRFVPGTGSPGDSGIDLDALRDAVSGMFPGFNMNFGDLGNYLQNGGYGSTTGLTYDPATGSFRQPGTQTTTTPPGTTTTDLNQNQNQFDPNNFQFNPFVDGFDMSSLPGYGQNTTSQLPDDFMNSYLMQSPAGRSEPPPDFTGATGNLTGIDQFADPSYNQPFQYDFSGLGQMNQMGDMGGYDTQFQGFQPLSTDFGSTYQAPAMNLPTFDASAYAPQQMDFGSMGYGLGSLPTIASTYQPQSVQTPTFDMSSFQMPASQSPMMTGGDTGMSNMSTAPQLGFGNSDVLYGRTDFGQGGSNNIFGFAGGGAIQKAAAGKLVTGDGDGMSDDIRANINGTQEARLADGEFVIPADVVSHLGNGSTDAGADRLYSMMDRIRKARTGRTRQAPEIDAEKYLPA